MFKASQILGLVAFVSSIGLQAKTHTIEMKNQHENQQMVFVPSYLEVAPGDTVNFVSIDSGHITQSLVLPKGASTWKSSGNDLIEHATLKQEGLYVFECSNHAVMSMFGVIVVGKTISNASEAIAVLEKKKAEAAIGKTQIEYLIEKIKKVSGET